MSRSNTNTLAAANSPLKFTYSNGANGMAPSR